MTREKIVASLAQRFVCIADESKRVHVLGTSGTATVRVNADGSPLVTDNGQHILDVEGLRITDPLAFENEVSVWPGVVTVGVFAHQRASVCLLGTGHGVRTIEY